MNGTHLLVATGHKPNMEGLHLEMAHVGYTPRGIVVDDRLRTSEKHIYAIGDVIGKQKFTHVANYHASVVLANMLFKLPTKVKTKAIPWVTYTDPELAQVGMTEAEAREKGSTIRVLQWPYEENDRARTELKTTGFIKVITTKRGKILGATIIGANAGELITPWILLMNKNLTVKALSDCIIPYPTMGEINKRVAGAFYTPFLFGDRMKKIVRFLLRYF